MCYIAKLSNEHFANIIQQLGIYSYNNRMKENLNYVTSCVNEQKLIINLMTISFALILCHVMML